MRILIVSSHYWPEPSGNAPYVTGLAEALATQGHEVALVCGEPHYPWWERQRHYPRRQRRAGVAIRRHRHYVPKRQKPFYRALYEATLLGGLVTIPWRRPDVVVGVVPSLAGGVISALAAGIYRCPRVLIFQDLVSHGATQSGLASAGVLTGAIARIETALARGAAAVSVVAPSFRPILEARGVDGGKIQHIRNWVRPVQPSLSRAAAREANGWGDDDFVCLHGGNLGQKQGLENVLEAAALLRDRTEFRFVLAGDGSARGALRERAVGLQLPNVSFIPSQDDADHAALLRAADVLLVNQRPEVQDMSLPSKLTSYFSAGRPVVAAVASASDTAGECIAAGAIVVPAADPPALAVALEMLRADPERRSRIADKVKRYSMEVLASERALRAYEALLQAAVRAAAKPAHRGVAAASTEVASLTSGARSSQPPEVS